ncbi:MAG: histidinol-phosphate transaminase [Lachnospiraceae bacterium]|nr:histidinol-phosphate transaminase [Lachnospiraceae bacterium]
MNWEKNVRRVVPYVPGEQPKAEKVIKLNTNENPYPPAPGVQAKMVAFADRFDELRLYPSPTVEDLVKELALYHKVPEEKVFVGVGSDDVLATAFLTFFNSDKAILFPDVTYSFYDVWAALYGIPFETKKLDGNYRIIPEDYMVENGGIVIANPNAPTGIALGRDVLERIIAANPDSVVIVDEAYVDFGGESCIPLTDKYENLLVVQTFSKSRSMAGLRVGVAIGSPKLIAYLNDVKFSINSYTINLPTLEYAVESLRDEAYFRKCVDRICATREWTKEQLTALGYEVLESKTNFLFAKPAAYTAEEVFEYLKTKHIYVRHFKGERVKDYLRISIGTAEEMQELIQTLKDWRK